jgi:hypothetical protein
MSIHVKTATGWEELGVSGGSGGTSWGDWTIVDTPDEADTWKAPDSQGRIWKYVAFNTPGTYDINLSGGMYWMLVVGGGSNGWKAAVGYEEGQPGLVREGYWEFGSGTQTVTVGDVGPQANFIMAGWSGVGDRLAGFTTQGGVQFGWEGGGRGTVAVDQYYEKKGFASAITGDSLEYGTGARGENRPGKGGWGAGAPPNPGCVIIATVDEEKTDWNPPGALPGIGGWATITSVWNGTGTKPNRYTYNDGPSGVGGTDWVAFEWAADGSVTTTEGLIEYALAGSGAANIDNKWGQPGDFSTGLTSVTAKTHAITIGIGGAPGSNIDDTPRAQPNTILQDVAYARGHQSTINYYDPATFQAYTTSLTGTERELCGYPYTGQTEHPGMGGRSGGVYNPVAQDGICIVRVPAAQAAGVDPTTYNDITTFDLAKQAAKDAAKSAVKETVKDKRKKR